MDASIIITMEWIDRGLSWENEQVSKTGTPQDETDRDRSFTE